MFIHQKILSLLFITLIVLVGCEMKELQIDTPEQQANVGLLEVNIGALVPLTKKGASYGVQIRAAMEVAVEEINATGGIDGRKLHMILLDSEGDNARGLQQTRKLINKHKVMALHGPDWSAVSEAVFPICQRSSILCFSPTSTKPGVRPQPVPLTTL